MDIFEEAKKFGVDPGSSDGIDYETLCRKVSEAKKDFYETKKYYMENRKFWFLAVATIINIIIGTINIFLH